MIAAPMAFSLAGPTVVSPCCQSVSVGQPVADVAAIRCTIGLRTVTLFPASVSRTRMVTV